MIRLSNYFVPALVIGIWSLVIAEWTFAAGLVPIGTQPRGGLTGKIVYTHGGHGITAENEKDGSWTFQRGPARGMVEDLGNVDQMTFLVDYLFRAGATVVPLRPVGHQPNEVVIDNDDPAVTYTGEWAKGKGSVYFGKNAADPYRETHTSKSETAHARYTPKIPKDGFYPVYAWTSYGGDRATDQLYRVRHSGGITEVTVNHRRVGNGLVYLGTYYFEAGTGGYVDISNRSNDEGSIVVADMIRFGNGKGDISRGKAGVSGWERGDESGLYWVMWHVDRATGVSESDYRETRIDRQAAVSFSPRYAAYMNREADGRLKDRVFVSFHSNASGGRGTLGLFNGNNDKTTATPNQQLLAQSLASEVNNEMVAQKGQFEHDWFDRGKNVTLDRTDIEFGEINNHYVRDEFDATIVEVAFHDNQEDAELMRDPKARDAIARATYHGLMNYFRAVDGNKTPDIALPSPVTGLHVESNDAKSVTISWKPPQMNSYSGGPATGNRIYASTNGYGFDGGIQIDGNPTNFTLVGYDAKTPLYLKVAAANDGGEAEASEVVAVLPSGGEKQVLIVNGYNRMDRSLDPKQEYQGKTVYRVWPRQCNSRDYVVQAATAIHAAAPDVHFATTSNGAVISGDVNLRDYKTVIWMLGKESSADRTFDEAEQKKVDEFIAGGGNLLVTGSDIGFDLVEKENGRTFFENTLKAKYVSNNAKAYTVSGAPGGIFDGVRFSFENGSLLYDVNSPDVIEPQSGAQLALTYGKGGKKPRGAGVQVAGAGGRGSVVMFAFPFETITTAADRTEVIRRVFDFFNQPRGRSSR